MGQRGNGAAEGSVARPGATWAEQWLGRGNPVPRVAVVGEVAPLQMVAWTLRVEQVRAVPARGLRALKASALMYFQRRRDQWLAFAALVEPGAVEVVPMPAWEEWLQREKRRTGALLGDVAGLVAARGGMEELARAQRHEFNVIANALLQDIAVFDLIEKKLEEAEATRT